MAFRVVGVCRLDNYDCDDRSLIWRNDILTDDHPLFDIRFGQRHKFIKKSFRLLRLSSSENSKVGHDKKAYRKVRKFFSLGM